MALSEEPDNKEIKFRKMILSDALEISLLCNRYYADSLRCSSFLIDAMYDNRFSFIYKIRDEIVGAIIAEELKDVVHISTLCVAQEHSSCGIGHHLMALCIAEIHKTCPGTAIRLMVSEKNTRAISIYKKLGFEILRLEKSAYFDSSDGYVMELGPVDCG